MKKLIAAAFILSVLIINFSSCKKGAGPGGTSSIKGKVWVKQYDKIFSTLNFQYGGYNQSIYIIYDNAVSPGASVKADYDGNFEFLYLQKGLYKIYAYSADSAKVVGPPINTNAPQKAVIKDLEITKNKQTVDAGTLTILINK